MSDEMTRKDNKNYLFMVIYNKKFYHQQSTYPKQLGQTK